MHIMTEPHNAGTTAYNKKPHNDGTTAYNNRTTSYNNKITAYIITNPHHIFIT